MSGRALLCLLIGACAGCSGGASAFVAERAQAHVRMIAGVIGSRPVGTPANLRAREYIVEQLRASGFTVRVQEVDARRPELGRTARVANIVAVLPGERPEAVGLVTHYDSSPFGPGAADAGLGVAVALESARAFAAGARRHWTLLVLVTDGEETGLMGAAGLVLDRAVLERLEAYINLDAIGSSGTALLFETGPGNAWLVSPWARRAPHPRGGSYALEIYRRLPNDTDFSILKTRDIPGLNFAAFGDSYAYHTDRDTVERLSAETIRTTGDNVLAVLMALQELDITRRTSRTATYFDIAGTAAAAYDTGTQQVLSAVALLAGALAWLRLLRASARATGALRTAMIFLWSWAGAALAFGGSVFAVWLLRAGREVYHPWYAHPGRTFALIVVTGLAVGWGVVRLGALVSRSTVRPPALAWVVALPAWIALTALVTWHAPAAGHLWALPLLAAGLLLPWAPARDRAVRLGSFLVLAVSAALWLRDTHDLLRFTVALMGRMPVVTPVWVYPAEIAAAALLVLPPAAALFAPAHPLRRPWLVTSLLLAAAAVSLSSAWLAPAYTPEAPLRRQVRALQDGDAPSAIWEVASVEPGLDLGRGAPDGWAPPDGPAEARVPWAPLPHPFVFRTEGPGLGPAPVDISEFDLRPLPDGLELRIALVPREPGLVTSFVLPAGILPARSSLPGISRLGRWTADFIAPPPEGIAWEARFRDVTAAELRDTRVAVTAAGFPGGAGPHRLPGWLPRERVAWAAAATWVVDAAAPPAIAPVPPLR